MSATPSTEWDAALVRKWLESRITTSRLDQATAQRGGRREEDVCDKASAEEMVCLHVQNAADDKAVFAERLRSLLDRDDYLWRGIYDDTRFDRHVRGYVRNLLKMTKTRSAFDKTGRFQ